MSAGAASERPLKQGRAPPDPSPTQSRIKRWRRTPEISTPTTLDARGFPHILQRVIDLADFTSLLALRGVSCSVRESVDARLCQHLIVRAPSKRTPGTYFYTETKPRRPYSDTDPLPIPCFAYYYEQADDAYSLRHLREQWDSDEEDGFGGGGWGWSAWGTHSHSRRGGGGPPRIRKRPFSREKPREEMELAQVWCCQALIHTRLVEIHGEVYGPLVPLVSTPDVLQRVQTVRVFPDNQGNLVCSVRIPSRNLFLALSLRYIFMSGGDLHSAPAMIPSFPRTVERLTLRVTFYARVDHIDTSISSFAFNPALRDVAIILKPCNGDYQDEPVPHPRLFGVLADVIENAIPHLDRVRVTIIGLDPQSGPMLGLVDDTFTPDNQPVKEDGYPPWWTEIELNNWDAITANLTTRLHAEVARKVRQRARTWERDGHGWSEEKIKTAIANFRVMPRQDWIEECKTNGNECDSQLGTLL